MARRGLGYVPDPADVRDLRYAFSAPADLALPPSADCLELLHPILDQGQIGTCVPHSVAQVIHAAHRRAGVQAPKILSRLALYWLCRAAGTPGADVALTKWDVGTHIRTAFQVLSRFGFCPEDAFPYSDSREGELDERAPYQRQPPAMAFMRSHDQKDPTTYRRIHETGGGRVRAVKAAIADRRAVAFGSTVSADFVDGRLPDGPIGPPAGELAGGHAMTLVGYDGDRFLVANSWGEGFAHAGAPLGFFWMDVDWLASSDVRDLWWAEHVPPYSEAA